MIIKRISFYTFSIYINTIVLTIQGIIIARLLSPYNMGYFSQIKVILSYLPLINVGIINGLLIVLPEKTKEEINIYKQTSIISSLFLYILISVLLYILYIFYNEKILFYSAILFPLWGLKDIPLFIMRGESKFNSLSKYYLFISFFNLLVLSIFVYLYGFLGALWGLAIVSFFNFIIGLFFGKIKLGFQISLKSLKYLQNKGFPIYLVYVFNFVKDFYEKFLVMFLIDKVHYAYYTIALLMVSVYEIIPSTISQFFLPDFVKNPLKWNNEQITKVITFIMFVLVNLLVLGVIIFAIFIPIILPEYKISVDIFYIFSIMSIISVFNYIIYNKLISTNKAKYIYFSQTIGFAFMFIIVLYSYFLKKHLSVIEIAKIVVLIRVAYISVLFLFIAIKEKIYICNIKMCLFTILSIIYLYFSIIIIKNYNIMYVFVPIILYNLLLFNKIKRMRE